jgi:3-oxoacyl-[acyl-carrier-protein] synthase-3
MSRRAAIIGTGSALPARRVTNAELAETVDTSDEWIVERTGIRARHIAADGETTATLATEAARKALDLGRVAAEPSTSALNHPRHVDPGPRPFRPAPPGSQAAARHRRLHRLSTSGVCTGFPLCPLDRRQHDQGRHGRQRAGDRIGNLHPHPRLGGRGTCVLFGDGAGAVVLRPRRTGSAASSPPASTPTAGHTSSSMSTAGPRPPRTVGNCG